MSFIRAFNALYSLSPLIWPFMLNLLIIQVLLRIITLEIFHVFISVLHTLPIILGVWLLVWINWAEISYHSFLFIASFFTCPIIFYLLIVLILLVLHVTILSLIFVFLINLIRIGLFEVGIIVLIFRIIVIIVRNTVIWVLIRIRTSINLALGLFIRAATRHWKWTANVRIIVNSIPSPSYIYIVSSTTSVSFVHSCRYNLIICFSRSVGPFIFNIDSLEDLVLMRTKRIGFPYYIKFDFVFDTPQFDSFVITARHEKVRIWRVAIYLVDDVGVPFETWIKPWSPNFE